MMLTGVVFAVVLAVAPTDAAAAHVSTAAPTAPSSTASGDVGFAVVRVAGATAASTAAAVSRRFYGPGVAAAFVVTSADFADALAVGPVAAKVGGPILYARRTAVPSSTVTELQRLRPGRIHVIGDEASISESVACDSPR